MDGTEHGPGWSIVVTGGEEADLSDTDIGFGGKRWGQGLRYLDPIGVRLRGAPETPRPRRRLRLADMAHVSLDPVVAHPPRAVATWNRIEARLVDDWVAWCVSRGGQVRQPVVDTDEGTVLRADGFDTTTGLLIEAKGSSSRARPHGNRTVP
jgi:hypothetical protein